MRRLVTMDDYLSHANRMMGYWMDNRFDEVIRQAEVYADSSMFHALMLKAITFVEMVLTMSKVEMRKAIEKSKVAMTKIESRRYVKSYRNLLIKPDYNSYTDDECHAELCFAFGSINIGGLVALSDESVYGEESASRELGTCSTRT